MQELANGAAVNDCPHCGKAVFRQSKDQKKLKAKTSIVVLHKGGDVEINCGSCGKGVLLPLVVKAGSPTLQKARAPKLVVPKT